MNSLAPQAGLQLAQCCLACLLQSIAVATISIQLWRRAGRGAFLPGTSVHVRFYVPWQEICFKLQPPQTYILAAWESFCALDPLFTQAPYLAPPIGWVQVLLQ